MVFGFHDTASQDSVFNLEYCFQTIIDDHRENLEAQLVCWDQLQSGKDEVANWVNSMLGKLDDSLKNFDDAVSVDARLTKFKVKYQKWLQL